MTLQLRCDSRVKHLFETLKPSARLTCNGILRLSGSVRFGQRFLGRCLSYRILRCLRLVRRSCLRSIFCQRRADSALIRVVRFSRLIGNLDTTDSEASAQVGPFRRRYKRNRKPTPRCSCSDSPAGPHAEPLQTHETPLFRVAFRVPALVTGLPANYGRWLFPPRLLQALSAGLPLLWRFALAERLLFLRAGRNFSSSRYITGTLLDSNRHAVQNCFYFQPVNRSETGVMF